MIMIAMAMTGGNPPRDDAFVGIIKAGPSWHFDTGAVARHGIKPEVSRLMGRNLREVMDAVENAFVSADRVVAYNSDFHRHVLERSAAECELSWSWPKDFWFCAMRAATPIVKVPRMQPGGGYSFPKMTVAYRHFSEQELVLSDDPIEAGAQLIRAVQAIDQGIAAVLNPISRGGSLE
jgi:hypothetical protein